jgi:excinuclease ABC subunit C
MPARRRRRRPVAPTATELARFEAMRALVKGEARDEPGVYRMTSPEGEVIYVGKSKALRTRLLSYFRAQYPRDKGARILRQAATLAWDPLPSEFAALLREMQLIKQLRPRYNVAMKRDDRAYAFVRLSQGPAPRLHIVRSAGLDESATYYGPFRGAYQLEEAVRALNDVLGLRDCALSTPMFFPDRPDLGLARTRTPGCIRHEIGKCLGPCIGAAPETAYLEQVRTALAFLEGEDESPLAPLRAEMERASESLDFERAGVWRDKVRSLEALREQFARLRFALESLSFVYRIPGETPETDRTYVIRRGRVRHECPTPRTARERTALAERIHAVVAPEESEQTTVPGHEVDDVLLVAAWLKRNPKELKRTKPLTP